MSRPHARALLVSSVAALTAGLAVAPAAAPATVRTDAVLAWNATAGDAAIAGCLSPVGNPLHESRMNAMTHVAIHDALNAIDRRSRPYAFSGSAARGASVDAAVAAAARDVLVPTLRALPSPPECITAAVAGVEADYAAALEPLAEGSAKRRGLRVGRASAAAILAEREGDGAERPVLDPDYPQGTRPGEWRFTPGFPLAFGTQWDEVAPFVLSSSAQYRAGRPHSVRSAAYTRDFAEVKRLGGDDVTTPSERTAEETEIAHFWVESSPLQWNRIARTVAAARALDPWEQARLLGLLNVALADGYIGAFETKYRYPFWRPVTAIRLAGTDGNPSTDADPRWTPLVPTPPIPDHDSAHSVEGGAAARVLRRYFGTDRVRFTTCSLTLPAGRTCADAAPVLRTYASFTEAEQENGRSRVYVGFHFRHAVEAGIGHGRKIGSRAVEVAFRPGG